MTETIIVFCTCGSQKEASHVAKELVEKRLAACVNIIPTMQSVYRWEDRVEEASEHLLLIKSTAKLFERLRKSIVELHSYEVPEIIAVPVAEGTEPYLCWVKESVLPR